MESDSPSPTSVLGRLRAIMPWQGLSESAALAIAERQAQMLLLMVGGVLPRAPQQVLAQIPRIEVELVDDLPVAGVSYWTGSCWRLEANRQEPIARQRFTVAHELKHVIDHPGVDLFYPSDSVSERIADHFAACLLMPRGPVIEAWCASARPDLGELADRFAVSVLAMYRRLRSLQLIADRDRSLIAGLSAKALPSVARVAIAGSPSIGDQP